MVQKTWEVVLLDKMINASSKIFTLRDGGGLYKETNLNHFIVEPINALTAFIFVFIAVYWIYKLLKSNNKGRIFYLTLSIILLFGGIGGTIYHAFRYHKFFLYLDWVPIVLVSFAVSLYLFFISTKSIWYGFVFCMGAFMAQYALFTITKYFPEQFPVTIMINMSYVFLALTILVPLFMFLRLNNFYNLRIVVWSLAFFVFALIFRWLDSKVPLSIGTHFLWHIFGALSCHLMFSFLYKTNQSVRNTVKYP